MLSAAVANTVMGNMAKAQRQTCRNCYHCEALIYSDYRARCLKTGELFYSKDSPACGEWEHYLHHQMERRMAR